MLSKPIQNLVEFFLKLPGVGPRQATRFAFYLLREKRERVAALSEAIGRLQDEVKICAQCYKTYDTNASMKLGQSHSAATQNFCELCRDARRNPCLIAVVEKEVDFENIERTRKFGGLYHVLGGTISPLDSSAPAKLHLKELFDRVQKLATAGGETEVILATNPTAEGDATALYLERIFSPLRNQYPGLQLSRLGRGLNTGSELEYADEVTISSALENRK